jgi:RHH-type transcriptional regulator, rel operon repressor / antitoxin RelB
MTSSTLTIRVATTQKKRLEALSKSTGRSRSFLAADALETYLNVNEWQVAGIKAAIKSMDSNSGADHADVETWVSSWSKPGGVAKKPRARKL